jgi:dynein heavy chain
VWLGPLPPTWQHVILLVWRSSAYYNTPRRLVLLLQEICNTLVRQARK